MMVVAVAAVGYVALMLWAGWRDVLAASLRAGAGVIAGMLALSLLNYVLRCVRWNHYLHRLDAPVPWAISARIYFAGFALTTTPGKLGELFRGLLLKPHGVPLMASTAAFFAERAIDLLTIVLMCGMVFRLYPVATPLVLVCGGVVVASILAVQSPRWIHAIDRWAGRQHFRWAHTLSHLCSLVLNFRRCFDLPTISYALLLGIVAWGAEALGFHWLLLALGYSPPLAMSVFIYSFAMLAGGVSFLPGGIGGSELVMVGLLVWQGVAEPVAVSATLITRLATLWFAVALGALALFGQRRALC
jgi:uncharacterized protein (TIRG00374 family)